MNPKEVLRRIPYGVAVAAVGTISIFGCQREVNPESTPTPIMPPPLDFSEEGMKRLREFAEERLREIELTLTPTGPEVLERVQETPTPTINLPPIRQT